MDVRIPTFRDNGVASSSSVEVSKTNEFFGHRTLEDDTTTLSRNIFSQLPNDAASLTKNTPRPDRCEIFKICQLLYPHHFRNSVLNKQKNEPKKTSSVYDCTVEDVE